VCVEADGARGARRADLAEDDRVAARHRHERRIDAAFLHQRDDRFGIALDVVAIPRDVRKRQQADEFVDDGALVLLPPAACGRGGGIRLGRDRRGQQS